MKFLIDAQLPARLAVNLEAAGHDVIHTLRMPRANRTGDSDIRKRADTEGRIVVTKDKDFRQTHDAIGTPRLLLHVKVGNTTAAILNDLIMNNLDTILAAFDGSNLVEITEGSITVW